MTRRILDEILAAKRRRVSELKAATDLSELKRHAHAVRAESTAFRLFEVLSDRSRINVIAEFKRASPSKGVIDGLRDPVAAASAYEKGGAAAISVLTEEDFFRGSLRDLQDVRSVVKLPILRKDFVVDEAQIYESAAAGADAVLLIVKALSQEELSTFSRVARELGMDSLVEAHDAQEFETAVSIGANIIGINNRNLTTFDVSLETSRTLIENKPTGSLMVSESGIRSNKDILDLRQLGYDGFLVGETLMRSSDPEMEVGKLIKLRVPGKADRFEQFAGSDL